MKHRASPVGLVGAVVGLALLAAAWSVSTYAEDKSSARQVVDVVALAKQYADGGGYRWPKTKDQPQSTGSPREVVWQGERVLKQGVDDEGRPGTSYCSGFTFAVMMDALVAAKAEDRVTIEQAKRMQRVWYGATPDKDDAEYQCVRAMEAAGIGQRVALEDARPGDFVQIWRAPGLYNFSSGHSAVFLSFVLDDRKRPIGLRYRSSQSSTQGIGDRVEYFNDVPEQKGKVERARTYFGRLTLDANL